MPGKLVHHCKKPHNFSKSDNERDNYSAENKMHLKCVMLMPYYCDAQTLSFPVKGMYSLPVILAGSLTYAYTTLHAFERLYPY